MLQVGDKVYIEDSAQIDIGFMAWSHIKAHPYAVVKHRMDFAGKELPESERVYALEWPEKFSGGHNCHGNCLDQQGQFIAYKHLSLDFEGSREVCTVPQLASPEAFEGLVTK